MSRETERLVAGIRHRLQLRVDERLTVPALSSAFTGFTDMPPVFATALMVRFIETCIELLRSALRPEFKTVGTHVEISHVAATPIWNDCNGRCRAHLGRGKKSALLR